MMSVAGSLNDSAPSHTVSTGTATAITPLRTNIDQDSASIPEFTGSQNGSRNSDNLDHLDSLAIPATTHGIFDLDQGNANPDSTQVALDSDTASSVKMDCVVDLTCGAPSQFSFISSAISPATCPVASPPSMPIPVTPPGTPTTPTTPFTPPNSPPATPPGTPPGTPPPNSPVKSPKPSKVAFSMPSSPLSQTIATASFPSTLAKGMPSSVTPGAEVTEFIPVRGTRDETLLASTLAKPIIEASPASPAHLWKDDKKDGDIKGQGSCDSTEYLKEARLPGGIDKRENANACQEDPALADKNSTTTVLESAGLLKDDNGKGLDIQVSVIKPVATDLKDFKDIPSYSEKHVILNKEYTHLDAKHSDDDAQCEDEYGVVGECVVLKSNTALTPGIVAADFTFSDLSSGDMWDESLLPSRVEAAPEGPVTGIWEEEEEREKEDRKDAAEMEIPSRPCSDTFIPLSRDSAVPLDCTAKRYSRCLVEEPVVSDKSLDLGSTPLPDYGDRRPAQCSTADSLLASENIALLGEGGALSPSAYGEVTEPGTSTNIETISSPDVKGEEVDSKCPTEKLVAPKEDCILVHERNASPPDDVTNAPSTTEGPVIKNEDFAQSDQVSRELEEEYKELTAIKGEPGIGQFWQEDSIVYLPGVCESLPLDPEESEEPVISGTSTVPGITAQHCNDGTGNAAHFFPDELVASFKNCSPLDAFLSDSSNPLSLSDESASVTRESARNVWDNFKFSLPNTSKSSQCSSSIGDPLPFDPESRDIVWPLSSENAWPTSTPQVRWEDEPSKPYYTALTPESCDSDSQAYDLESADPPANSRAKVKSVPSDEAEMWGTDSALALSPACSPLQNRECNPRANGTCSYFVPHYFTSKTFDNISNTSSKGSDTITPNSSSISIGMSGLNWASTISALESDVPVTEEEPCGDVELHKCLSTNVDTKFPRKLASDSWTSVRSSSVDVKLDNSQWKHSLADSTGENSESCVGLSSVDDDLSSYVAANSSLTTVSEMSSQIDDLQSPSRNPSTVGASLLLDSLILLASDSKTVASDAECSSGYVCPTIPKTRPPCVKNVLQSPLRISHSNYKEGLFGNVHGSQPCGDLEAFPKLESVPILGSSCVDDKLPFVKIDAGPEARMSSAAGECFKSHQVGENVSRASPISYVTFSQENKLAFVHDDVPFRPPGVGIADVTSVKSLSADLSSLELPSLKKRSNSLPVSKSTSSERVDSLVSSEFPICSQKDFLSLSKSLEVVHHSPTATGYPLASYNLPPFYPIVPTPSSDTLSRNMSKNSLQTRCRISAPSTTKNRWDSSCIESMPFNLSPSIVSRDKPSDDLPPVSAAGLGAVGEARKDSRMVSSSCVSSVCTTDSEKSSLLPLHPALAFIGCDILPTEATTGEGLYEDTTCPVNVPVKLSCMNSNKIQTSSTTGHQLPVKVGSSFPDAQLSTSDSAGDESVPNTVNKSFDIPVSELLLAIDERFSRIKSGFSCGEMVNWSSDDSENGVKGNSGSVPLQQKKDSGKYSIERERSERANTLLYAH